MLINEIIKTTMKEKGFTQLSMAKAIGKTNATDVSARLASKNMTFSKAIEMLEVMNYEVIVQPKPKGGVRKAGQIVVTVEGE